MVIAFGHPTSFEEAWMEVVAWWSVRYVHSPDVDQGLCLSMNSVSPAYGMGEMITDLRLIDFKMRMLKQRALEDLAQQRLKEAEQRRRQKHAAKYL